MSNKQFEELFKENEKINNELKHKADLIAKTKDKKEKIMKIDYKKNENKKLEKFDDEEYFNEKNSSKDEKEDIFAQIEILKKETEISLVRKIQEYRLENEENG